MDRRAVIAGVLAAAAAVAAGCIHYSHDPFPLGVGFQPLEPALDPRVVPPDVSGGYPVLGQIVKDAGNGYQWAQAIGYVKSSLDEVYAALHDPRATYIHIPSGDCDFTPITEDPNDPTRFPVDYQIHYKNVGTPIPSVTVGWLVVFRAGPLATDAAGKPTIIGQRYQKTSGISNIKVMTGSLQAFPSDFDPSVTRIELIEWLNAPDSSPDGTLRDIWSDLTDFLGGNPQNLCSVKPS
jgi:hypothetical protein